MLKPIPLINETLAKLGPLSRILNYKFLNCEACSSVEKSLLTDSDGAQVEPLRIFILVHVVVVEGGQVPHGQSHLVVLVAQELLLDLDGFDVHLLRFLVKRTRAKNTQNTDVNKMWI